MTSPNPEKTNDVVDAANQDSPEAKKTTEETRADVEKAGKEVNALHLTGAAVDELKKEDIGKLFRWWKESISTDQVAEAVNSLKDKEFKGKIIEYIKSKNIKEMQKYINDKIKTGYIDKAKLSEALKSKWIRFDEDNGIDMDGRFWPQTLETLKHIAEVTENSIGWGQDKPKEEEKPWEKEKKESAERPDLSWIPNEMAKVLDGIRATDDSKDRSPERNLKDGAPWDSNWNIDFKSGLISIATWGKELNGEIDSHVPGNRCELDWKNGIIYVICDKYKYEMPVKVNNGLEMDEKWYPKDTAENRTKIQAFTKVLNLMNMLKANYVFNWWKYSFEHSWWDLEYNNGTLDDTEIVSEEAFDKINNSYATVWVKFDKAEKRDMACLLNAMKYDIGKVTMDEIEDGCYDEDVQRSKHFSKKFEN